MLKKYKLVLLGATTVGKSSIFDRLISDVYINVKDSTIGASFGILKIKNKNIELDVWDTAGQERYLSLAPIYYNNAHVILLVFNLNEIDTVEMLYYHMNKLKTVHSMCRIIIVGNKSDLLYKHNGDIIGIKIAIAKFFEAYPESKFEYIEVSAKTTENIDKLTDMIIAGCNKIGLSDAGGEYGDDYNFDLDLDNLEAEYNCMAITNYCNPL